MKPKKILLLALLSGIITTLVFYLFLNQLKPVEAEVPPMVQVITASQDMAENQQITKESISIIDMPEADVHAQAVRKPETVIGAFTTAAVKSGEILMLHRIQQEEEEADFVSKKVTEGHRAVSINVDYVKSVSNLTEPGDYVDVVWTEAESVKSELILEKVRVLAVGKRMIEVKEGEVAAEYMAVTLELKPEKAVKLINASERGNLQLTIHSKLLPPDETEEVDSEDEKQPTKEAKKEKQTKTSGEDKKAEVQHTSVTVQTVQAKIRTNPSMKAAVLMLANRGVVFRYLDKKETDEDGRIWFQIETPDKEKGWISSRIVKTNTDE